MEEPHAEMATANTTVNNNSDSEASPGRSSPASQQSEPGSRAAAQDATAGRPEPATSSVAPAAGSSSRRRRAADWEIMQGLRTGQRCDDKPRKFEGYLLKRRKWPLKGWHKRFFCLEKGILTYAKSSTDMAKGKNHGSVDLGLSVISTKSKGRRIDIDAEEFIYHLKVKNQAQFQQWVSQLQHHRLYRQHEITFGSREAPKMTSPAAEDSSALSGANGPSGSSPLCSCSSSEGSPCRRHHCYRELMLSARTCTQAGLSSSVLGSQASCKCSKVATRSSTGDESLPPDAPTPPDFPSTSVTDKDCGAAGARQARASGKLQAGRSPSFLDMRESTSRTPLSPRRVNVGMGSSDETAPPGRSATTCGVDTDTFLVTFYPSIGSDYTDSLARWGSEEDARQNRGLCGRPPPGANGVKIPGHRGAEKVLKEGEMPCGCLSAPANCPNGTFIGLRTLREGVNVGVNTDPDGEVVEPEHTGWVTIVGSSHPQVRLKGRKQHNVSSAASQVASATHLPAQKSVLTGHSYSEAAANSAAPPKRKRGPPGVHSKGLSTGVLDRVGGSPGTSSEEKTESLLEPKPSRHKLNQKTTESPGLFLLSGLDKNDKFNFECRKEASPSTGWLHFTEDSASSVDGPRFAVHVSPVPSTETARQDAPPTSRLMGLQKSDEPRASTGADAGGAKQGKELCSGGAKIVPGQPLTKAKANYESSEDATDAVPATLKTPENAAHTPRLSRSGLMAEKSHQSGQSSSQYCTAWAEQTGTEFRDSLRTFVFLHSDSSCSGELEHFSSEVAAESRCDPSRGGPSVRSL